MGTGGAKVMDSLKLKKVSVLAQQNPFVIAMIEPFKAEMARLGGEVVDTVIYNPDQPSGPRSKRCSAQNRKAFSACRC
jgi:branched-chain amino acid transport system substrate-binding protein